MLIAMKPQELRRPLPSATSQRRLRHRQDQHSSFTDRRRIGRCVGYGDTDGSYIVRLQMRALLADLGLPQSAPTPLLEDNQACIKLGTNVFSNSRKSAHIDARYHRLRHEIVNQRTLRFVYVPTADQAADALTKPLPAPAVRRFQLAMSGAVPLPLPDLNGPPVVSVCPSPAQTCSHVCPMYDSLVDPFFRLQVSTLTLSRDLTRKREGVTAPGCSPPGQRFFCLLSRHTRPRAGHTALFPFI